MTSEILVIIVTFNGMQWIERCISSVKASTVPADILVIDNASTDGTPQWLQRHGVEVIQNSANIGFGAANNIGLKRVLDQGYAYAYLLNQDAYLLPDTMERMLEHFDETVYGVLSPIQYDGSGKKMDRNFSKKCKRAIKKSGDDPVANIRFVMAAHWMISRGCLLNTGGFSPAFKMYGEDDNYCDRARWHGFGVGVVKDAGGIHDRGQRKDAKDKRMFLKCNASAVHISDPLPGVLLRMIWEPLRLVGIGCVNFSGAPFRYIGELIGRYKELLRYRRKSRARGAFLVETKKASQKRRH